MKGASGGGGSRGRSYKPASQNVPLGANPFAHRRAVAAAAANPNPFEVRGNRRQKQEVLNRRVKGANRNVAKARSDATERRKRTLLVEHKNRKSANSFVDRRFGEADQSMSLEEKMFERFRKERQKRSRGSMYGLEDNEEDLLTHRGE